MQKSIRNWNEEDRPREKLMAKGTEALTNAELLAILITKGTKEKSALDLARDLLKIADNDLNELGKLSHEIMRQLKGIGPVKAVTIAAALELGRRRQRFTVQEKSKIGGSQDAFDIFNPMIGDHEHEALAILYLNTANKVKHTEVLSHGGLSATVVDIRLILKNALLHAAPKILIAHNHPSGNLTPSQSDKDITRKLQEASKLLDIQFLDHLIIGHNAYFSFADKDML